MQGSARWMAESPFRLSLSMLPLLEQYTRMSKQAEGWPTQPNGYVPNESNARLALTRLKHKTIKILVVVSSILLLLI